MVVPLILITTITLKEGKLEDFKRHSEQMGKFVEENEPRIIHFEQYINEDGTEMKGVQIYGEPSDAFVEQMKQRGSAMTASGAGYPVIVKSKFAGFNRLPATGLSEPAS